jgi:hypothetical protein
LGLWKKGVIGEDIVGEVRFDGFEIRHSFGDYSGFVSCATKLKIIFDYVLQLLLQLNQVVFRRQDYWNGLLALPGTTSSCVVA